MKKIFLFIALILGTSLSTFATETPATIANESGLTVIVNTLQENTTVEPEDVKSTENQQSKKKKKKKMKTWHYIAGGAFFVLVLVLYIVTEGEGYSSR